MWIKLLARTAKKIVKYTTDNMEEKTWNAKILKKVLDDARDNKSGGQCKAYMQQTIAKISRIWVPINDPNEKYKWKDAESSPNITERQVKTAADLKKGDILQILWDKKHVPVKYHWHTTIVKEVDLPNSAIYFADSNYHDKEMVTVHSDSIPAFDERCARLDNGNLAVTVYTIMKNV